MSSSTVLNASGYGLGLTQVLFVSAHNAARSLLAEALLNRLGAGRFEAHSAGYEPADCVSPYAVNLLTRINYNTQLLSPKGLDLVMSRWTPRLDFIIRLSPETARSQGVPVMAPALSGSPQVIDWHLPDPMSLTNKADIATAYEDLFNLLTNRIDVLSRLTPEFLKGGRAADYLEGLSDSHLRLAS